MFDFNSLAEFSRAYCVSICTFLVPANLVATSLTVVVTLSNYPTVQLWRFATIANFLALIMMLHVFSWFLVGMVMAPTYILLGLASICLFANLGAVFCRRQLDQVFEIVKCNLQRCD